MLNFIKRKLRKLTPLYFYCLVFILVTVTLLPWWPFYQWLIIPKYILLFGPRWWLLLLCLVAVILWPFLSKTKRLLLPVLLLGSLNYLDFQLPSLTHYFQSTDTREHTIKIITANIGGGGSMYEIQLLVKDEAPDILLLQEARKINFSKWFSSQYRANCKGGLCILSKLDFEVVGELNRKLIDGWGNFAMLYKIKTAQGEFSLANVHLETPRTVIMGVIHRVWDQAAATKIDSDRQYQALLISSWQQAQKNTLIGGDFNMLEDENIYQKYFSSIHNAIGHAGIGIYNTKKTSWHGARIDHLLFSQNFTLKDVRVVNSISGDHQPIVSVLNFNGE